MNPVVSLSSKETEELEDSDLLQYVLSHIQSVQIPSNYRIQSNDIGVVIRHHCGHRKLKKAALLSIPFIMNSNLPTAPWRKKTDSNGRPINPKDKRLSGMMSAPILIDGTKYLCNLSVKKDSQGIISPYAITLKDEGGNIIEKEKMDSHSQVPNSNSEPTTSGDAHLNKAATSLEANPSSDTKIINESKTRKDMKRTDLLTHPFIFQYHSGREI